MLTCSHKKGHMNMLSFALLSAFGCCIQQGRKTSIQIHSTSSVVSSWQKSPELLGLLIHLPSGQAAGAMKLCTDKVVADTFKWIPEFLKVVSSCLDNQLFFHFLPTPVSKLGPCTLVEPHRYLYKSYRAWSTCEIPQCMNIMGNLEIWELQI